MLSIAKLRVDAEAYYLSLVVGGVDEYYSERGEVPGRWMGRGVGALGLSGTVAGAELRTVLDGRAPSSGDPLASSQRTVPGFDLTFSAPKSVSVLFALGARDVAHQAVTAHDEAVRAALAYLERQACVVRRGHAGARQLPGDGFVAAAFGHRTSRAGDPQLHTHVLVANLARGSDAGWGALDGRLLYRQLSTAGYLYQAVLRHELTSRLGVAWGPVARGSADIDDIPTAVLRAFSRRRTAIEAAMSEHGASRGRGAAIATLATRPAKDERTPLGALRIQWHERAVALEFEHGGLDRLTRAAQPALIPVDAVGLGDALTAETASFDRRAVLRALAERASAGATIEVLEAHADQFLTAPPVVRLAEDRYISTTDRWRRCPTATCVPVI